MLGLNTTEIELCEGNFVNIPADAYLSPANKDLNNNGGLAKSVIEKLENKYKMNVMRMLKIDV